MMLKLSYYVTQPLTFSAPPAATPELTGDSWPQHLIQAEQLKTKWRAAVHNLPTVLYANPIFSFLQF